MIIIGRHWRYLVTEIWLDYNYDRDMQNINLYIYSHVKLYNSKLATVIDNLLNGNLVSLSVAIFNNIVPLIPFVFSVWLCPV